MPIRVPDLATSAFLIAAASAALLAGAYVFEHGFAILPCAVCLWQRPPHWIAGLIALAAGLLALRWSTQEGARAALALAVATLLIGAGIATYHVGVEQGFWPGPAACAVPGGPNVPQSITELIQAMETATVIRCDKPAWTFLGLSLAGYNLLASLALAAFGLAALLASSPRDQRSADAPPHPAAARFDHRPRFRNAGDDPR